jgi:hypothetical protein
MDTDMDTDTKMDMDTGMDSVMDMDIQYIDIHVGKSSR